MNNKAKYGVMDTMSSTVAKIERTEGDFLPDLRADSELALVSDYAGEHRRARFQVLSYLLTDRPGILRAWDDERRAIRLKYLNDGRRLEFKSLGDRNKQKALGPFLSAASSITGNVMEIDRTGGSKIIVGDWKVTITQQEAAELNRLRGLINPVEDHDIVSDSGPIGGGSMEIHINDNITFNNGYVYDGATSSYKYHTFSADVKNLADYINSLLRSYGFDERVIVDV